MASIRHESFQKAVGDNWFFLSDSSNCCASVMRCVSSVSSPSRSSSKPILSGSTILVEIVAVSSLESFCKSGVGVKISWQIFTCKHWVSRGSTSLSTQDKCPSCLRRVIEDSDDSDDKERTQVVRKRPKQEKQSSDAAHESRFVGRNLALLREQLSVNRGVDLLIEWSQLPGTANHLSMTN